MLHTPFGQPSTPSIDAVLRAAGPSPDFVSLSSRTGLSPARTQARFFELGLGATPGVNNAMTVANPFTASEFLGIGDIFTIIKEGGKLLGIGGGDDEVVPGSGSGTVPGGFAPRVCIPPFRTQADGSCRFDLDPGGGTGFPGGNGGGFPSGGTTAQGLQRPAARTVVVQSCPRFADGKKGLLWMNALTGEVVCLPRGTNGSGFGLIRKNKPRAKPFISAAMKKQLGVSAAATKKAKEFAKLTGQVCESKSTRAARNARGK